MCGICGIIEFDHSSVSKKDLIAMMGEMKHRGPDDEGYFIEDDIGLGFVRLSILDLSIAGHQPMFSDDERYIVVFNGEIYNYIEIRQQLIAKGHVFKSHSDTEVLLKSYIEWGEECLERFNGMWAFAIYDRREKSFFISRDRFGIKPLYYYYDNKRFIFASDIAPILRICNCRIEPNDQIIYDFLLFNRTNHKGDTFFKSIFKLQHSHKISIKGSEVRFSRYYNLADRLNSPFLKSGEFLESFKSSINNQLRSDVPVGACLSGGLDSSSIVSVIQKYFFNPELHTFSAVYQPGQRGDETEFIELYRDVIKNMHFTYPTSNSFMEDMDSFVESLGEPVPGTSEYAEYKVMQIASKHCTVILNGQGADEEMAGYLYFFGYMFKELLKKGNLFTLINEINAYRKVHRSNEGIKSFLYFLLPNELKTNRFILNKSVVRPEFASQFRQNSEDGIVDVLYNSRSLQESFINHFEYKFEHHLLWADKSGMWFSLETRFPFLDHNFVERILASPREMILSQGMTKRILRESMTDILPDKIRKRTDKVGYATPEDTWFREKKMGSFIMDILNSEGFKSRGYINQNQAISLFNKHLKGEINVSKEIWKWIHLELWFRKFIDNQEKNQKSFRILNGR
jgi:asparagine synthase (glutamine-hydrolysing)